MTASQIYISDRSKKIGIVDLGIEAFRVLSCPVQDRISEQTFHATVPVKQSNCKRRGSREYLQNNRNTTRIHFLLIYIFVY